MQRASLVRLVATAALLALAANCGGVTPAPEASAGGGGGGGGGDTPVIDLPLRALGTGPMSGHADEVFDVYRDEASWRGFWSTHAPDVAAPSVDFTREMVAAVVLQRNTGGFTVRIDGARVAGGLLVVSYSETRPRPEDVVIQVLTQPWAAAALPRREEPETFEPR